MLIAGGVYREECVVPHWSRVFGSGGRAAAAIAQQSPRSSLHAYAYHGWIDDAQDTMRALGVEAHLQPIQDEIFFSYFHPLSVPQLYADHLSMQSPLLVDGAAVLRFGFVEGDAIVGAQRAVYDPQNAREALTFSQNGSRADELAIVLNESELANSLGMQGPEAVAALKEKTGASVVIVKCGPRGATVYDGASMSNVPAYLTSTIFKIGSGDIFSAIFALHWAERRLPAQDAADLASRAVAAYVESKDAMLAEGAGSELTPSASPRSEKIYIAGPFFNIAQRWLIEEVRDVLRALGAEPFSPLHEVGAGGSSAHIAKADLAGLRQCSAVLAIVDGEDAGTLFEIGYARSRGIPVVVLAEAPHSETLTMLEGSGCEIVTDFCSAIYRAIWAAAP